MKHCDKNNVNRTKNSPFTEFPWFALMIVECADPDCCDKKQNTRQFFLGGMRLKLQVEDYILIDVTLSLK